MFTTEHTEQPEHNKTVERSDSLGRETPRRPTRARASKALVLKESAKAG